MKVYTAHISYTGPDRLDITVKSGNKAFAPTWSMVMASKRGEMSEAEYREQYIQKMRHSYLNNHEEWQKLMQQDQVTLVCYCKPGKFCHRIILAKILAEMGAQYLGERE